MDSFTARTRMAAATVWVVCLLMLFGREPAAAATDSVSEQIVEQLVNKFSSLSTLTYSVKRVSEVKGRPFEEKWSFRYRKPNSLRIQFESPLERLIILGPDACFEYIPSQGLASRITLSQLSVEKSSQALAGIMSQIAVPGLAVEQHRSFQRQPAEVSRVTREGNNVIRMEYASPKYILDIDPVRIALMHSELFDQSGALIMRTDAKRFIEVAAGFWMPREIHIVYGNPEGFSTSTIYLSDFMVNKKLSDDLFREPSLPSSVRIKNLN